MTPERHESGIFTVEKNYFLSDLTPIICDHRIQNYCRLPYPDHPKGCPNFARKPNYCPPTAPYFPDIFEPNAYIAAVSINFKQYLEIRKNIHPEWTDRALRNPRHWQGHIRTHLHQLAENALANNYGDTIIYNPEAMGVDLTATCYEAGIYLEWPPENLVYQIALLATQKQ